MQGAGFRSLRVKCLGIRGFGLSVGGRGFGDSTSASRINASSALLAYDTGTSVGLTSQMAAVKRCRLRPSRVLGNESEARFEVQDLWLP